MCFGEEKAPRKGEDGWFIYWRKEREVAGFAAILAECMWAGARLQLHGGGLAVCCGLQGVLCRCIVVVGGP